MGRTAKHGWPAAVLQAYAASIGANVRTAQRHASAGNPDFLRFAQGQAGENVLRVVPSEVVAPVDTALAPPQAPPEVQMRDEDLSETGRMLKAAWQMWASHYADWSVCRGGYKDKFGKDVPPDRPMMIMNAKLLIDLRKDYALAAAKHQAWQVDHRRLIPINEFERLRAEFILPMTNMIRNMPAEAAPLMNPQNQSVAISGGQQWLRERFMPAVQQLLDGFASMMPQMSAA